LVVERVEGGRSEIERFVHLDDREGGCHVDVSLRGLDRKHMY